MSTAPVRLDTHRALSPLFALFQRGPELVGERRDDAPGQLLFSWSDGQDRAYLWLAENDAANLETLKEIRRDPAMAVRARALLAKAVELHGQEGAFHLERVAELLHGKRDQRCSHRERHLPPLWRLLALFEQAHFHLVAKQPPPAPEQRRHRKGPDRRADYYGTVQGPLLRISRRNRRTATIWLSDQLHQLLVEKKAPFAVVPVEAFRLDDPAHRNPRGDLPSRADRASMRLGAFIYERLRNGAQKDGRVQAIRFSGFLRLSGLDPERIERRRRTSKFLDVAQADLIELGRLGPVGLAEPVRVEGKAADCLLRLTASPKHGRTPERRGHANQHSRPLAGITSTGSPRSTGPPL